jgi:hypothetical protein
MRSLRRDLLERKLWIIVAVLLAAVVAVPVLLLKSASAGGAPTLPAPPAADTVTSATSSQTSTTNSPSNAPAKVDLARIARDPFAASVPKLSAKPGSTAPATGSSSGTSSSSSTGSTPSSGSSTVSMVSPTPATGTATGSSTGSTSSSGGANSAGTTSTTSTTPTATVASTSPSTQPTTLVKVQSWTTYSVTVRFGKDLSVPLRTNIARLTPLPSGRAPEVMFMGVMSNGRSAVFALRQAIGHTGPGLCRPNHDLCSAIVLKAGQTERLTIPTASGGEQKVVLRVVSLTSSITHSQKVALDAFDRISHSGACDLLLSDPMLYNLETGTLSNVPKSICKGDANAAPFSYFRVAP